MKLTAVFEKVVEGYTGFVEELPGANIQGPPDAAKPLSHGLVHAADFIIVAEETVRSGYTRAAPSCTETLNEPRKGSIRIFYRIGFFIVLAATFRVLSRLSRAHCREAFEQRFSVRRMADEYTALYHRLIFSGSLRRVA